MSGTFNEITDRGVATPLMPEEYYDGLMGKVTAQSAAMALFRHIPVARGQVRIPVLSALPQAYWVAGDSGLKQTTHAEWKNKYLNIEELAVLIPIPENVLEDSAYDIWAEIEPLVAEAMGRALDAAIYFGTDAPGSFPRDILHAAASAGNKFEEGTAVDEGGFMGDIDFTLAKLEEDGYDASGYVAARSTRGALRQARNSLGDQLDRDRIGPKLDELDGVPVIYPMRGLFADKVRLFVGEWTQFVLGIRRDISLKVFDQGVIHDGSGSVTYNALQQDGVIGRVTFRVGWQVANTINYDQPEEINRYPVAVMQTPS